MIRRLESRLDHLEQQQPPSWRAYVGRPLRQWSNDALDALISWTDDPDVGLLSDAELWLLDKTCEADPLE